MSNTQQCRVRINDAACIAPTTTIRTCEVCTNFGSREGALAGGIGGNCVPSNTLKSQSSPNLRTAPSPSFGTEMTLNFTCFPSSVPSVSHVLKVH